MTTYDATRAHIFLYTFKEGMLSALAHDLKIEVTRADVQVDAAAKTVTAEIAADSLRVVTVMKKGQEARDELGPDHFKKIEKAIVDDVLHASKHPKIRFTSTAVREHDGGVAIEGTLELHGRSRSIAFAARRVGEVWTAQLDLHQPDWGITPYSAMMGTLKVKPTLQVSLSVPAA
jgi:polyisoprenoid-binding protein YceI